MTRRPGERAQALGRLLGWVTVVGGGEWALYGAGRGCLAGPPVAQPMRWLPWLTHREPVTAAFGILRVVGLVLGGYLLAVILLGVAVRAAALACGAVGRGARTLALVRAVDLVTLPGLRTVLEAAAGVGVAAAVWATPTWAAAEAPAPTVAASSASAPGTEGATMQRLDSPSPPMYAPDAARPQPPPAPPPPPPPPASPAKGTWTVVSGENLWAIARSHLAAEWGRTPSNAEVARVWTGLIEANRSRLRQPGNADLIYPGQELVLPPVSAP